MWDSNVLAMRDLIARPLPKPAKLKSWEITNGNANPECQQFFNTGWIGIIYI